MLNTIFSFKRGLEAVHLRVEAQGLGGDQRIHRSDSESLGFQIVS
jgi:hypothetical protein